MDKGPFNQSIHKKMLGIEGQKSLYKYVIHLQHQPCNQLVVEYIVVPMTIGTSTEAYRRCFSYMSVAKYWFYRDCVVANVQCPV